MDDFEDVAGLGSVAVFDLGGDEDAGRAPWYRYLVVFDLPRDGARPFLHVHEHGWSAFGWLTEEHEVDGARIAFEDIERDPAAQDEDLIETILDRGPLCATLPKPELHFVQLVRDEASSAAGWGCAVCWQPVMTVPSGEYLHIDAAALAEDGMLVVDHRQPGERHVPDGWRPAGR